MSKITGKIVALDERRRRISATEKAARLRWGHDSAETLLALFADTVIGLGKLGRFLQRVERCGGPNQATVRELAEMLIAARASACSRHKRQCAVASGVQLELPLLTCPCFTGPTTPAERVNLQHHDKVP